MEIPNYNRFKYTLNEEEKEKYKDLFEYEIKRLKYFESFTDDQLNRIWNDASNFISGGKAKGLFAKLKIKIKKGHAINPKIICALLMDEQKKRKLIGDKAFDLYMGRLKSRNICG